MAGEEEQKKGEGKGFAGLSSLVSDVDTTPPPAAKKEPPAAAPSAGRPASQPAQTQPQPSQRQTYQEPAQPSSGSSGGKWVLGIAAVIGVLWLIGQSNKTTTSPAPAYSPPAQSTAPSYSPSVQPQAPSRPQESKPPVGQDLVFSTAQIRYCLAEDIRMDGAKSAVDNYIDSDVDRFNAMVADYNSRCGSFRYRSGALESARRDVEPYRGQLQAEGRSRFARSSSTGSLSAPAPARPVADETVRAVQQKLNELGYSAGPADGLMGRGTRAAIIAFQQDRGLAATGVADQTLLFQLRQIPSGSARGSGANAPVVQDTPSRSTPTTAAPLFAPPSPSVQRSSPPPNSWVSGSNWYCKEGFRKVDSECVALVVPQNAFVSGSNWYCKEGFRKVDNECVALVVPQNAFVSGSNWYCKEGFRKVDNECVALVVPQNAFVSGSNWYCKEGFRKVGSECEALVVPQNAFVSGSSWYCKEGFRKVGNQCEALVVPQNAFVSGSNWYCKEGFRKVGDNCVSVFER